MAPKRRRVGTPRRAAKVSRGDRAHRGILKPAKCSPVPAPCHQRLKVATASATTATAVGLPVTTAGPLQPPPVSDDDTESLSSNSSFYAATTLSYSPSSCSDEEVENMRCSVDREEQLDSLVADAYSSFILAQESGNCRSDATPAAALAVRAPTCNGPLDSAMVEQVVPIHQLPQPNVTARKSTVPDT
ncbi:hypothetical protein HPB52_003893 [Rhipicephalus sanguineus]|uniref:Uncharacterized protein n=1 Tax=Rhipicephalus sanguineus TaxID=34632 RepID=A0A9D4PU65_RHISA|nr:hypothetical protein HPB52_003893 [Rhipicephalus sanguineus]